MVESFNKMGLKKKLLRGIHEIGLEKPFSVQQQAILPCIAGKDVIVQAESESGKTTAMCISVLQRVDEKKPNVQAVVMVPWKFAQQIMSSMTDLGKNMGVKLHLSIGGTDIQEEERDLKQHIVHVVIGTPGRVNHMIQRGALKTDNIKMLLLDKADWLFNPEMLEQTHEVLGSLPANVQVVFSASKLHGFVLEAAKKFMHNPVRIGQKLLNFNEIRQCYVSVDEQWKFETLCELLSTGQQRFSRIAIFCQSADRVKELAKNLLQKKFTVSTNYGDMEPQERDLALQAFRSGHSQILIATVAKNLIDVEQVSLAINYDLPSKNRMDYMHRCALVTNIQGLEHGQDRNGVVISFVDVDEKQKLKDLEIYCCTKIREMPANNVADELGELFI